MNKFVKAILIVGGLFFLIWIYTVYNPLESGFFPKCPFKQLTGLDCPGCGSQRAIHFLLNGSWELAWQSNPLLIVAIPYVVTGAFFDAAKKDNPKMLKWRNRLLGINAIKIIFVIVLLFWVGRNIV